jgi:hypothetical protein
MTLVEISLVISVLLSLISIIFFGVTSFSEGSARAKCVLRQAKLQKIAISYANLNGLNSGDTVPGIVTTLVDQKYVAKTPTCPGQGTYSFLTHIPSLNEKFVTCSIPSHVAN